MPGVPSLFNYHPWLPKPQHLYIISKLDPWSTFSDRVNKYSLQYWAYGAETLSLGLRAGALINSLPKQMTVTGSKVGRVQKEERPRPRDITGSVLTLTGIDVLSIFLVDKNIFEHLPKGMSYD